MPLPNAPNAHLERNMVALVPSLKSTQPQPAHLPKTVWNEHQREKAILSPFPIFHFVVKYPKIGNNIFL
jgi:hypothetical protein